jgi:hypothetical protein
MATYYVSPAGSNTSPYDTWAKAANLPETILALTSGQHLILVGPGSTALTCGLTGYQSYISVAGTNHAGTIIFGVSAAGVAANCNDSNYTSYPAAWWEVVVGATASNRGLYVLKNAIQVHNIQFADTTGSYDTIYIATGGTNFVGRNIGAINSSQHLFQCGASGLDIKGFWFRGSSYASQALIFTDDAGTSVMSLGMFGCSNTNYLGSGTAYGIRFNHSAGTITVNNSIVRGSLGIPLYQSGAGTTVFNNSQIYAGKSDVIGRRTNGGITLNNCYLVASQIAPATEFTGTVTTNNCVRTAARTLTNYGRTGFFSVAIDDGANLGYATNMAALLKEFGAHGTYAVSAAGLTGDVLTGVLALVADGTLEIACHGYSHSALDVEATDAVFSITKTGKTVNVDRTADTITVSDTGTVSGFKAKTLLAIRNELTAMGCLLGDLGVYQGSNSLGEIMADSGGAKNSPYSPLYLIDTTAATGFYKVEIKDAKAYMEAALGITINTLAAPSSLGCENAALAAIACGFTSFRYDTNAASLLQSIDLFSIRHNSALTTATTDADVVYWANSIFAAIATLGEYYIALSHTAEQVSVARWRLILTEAAKYPEITVTSHSAIAAYIMDSDDWTTADNRTYTRTWTDASDYHIYDRNSPCIDNGIDVGLTSDFAGNVVPWGMGVDIGPYETTLSKLDFFFVF